MEDLLVRGEGLEYMLYEEVKNRHQHIHISVT